MCDLQLRIASRSRRAESRKGAGSIWLPFVQDNVSVPARREREIFLHLAKVCEIFGLSANYGRFVSLAKLTSNIHFFVQDSDDFYSIRFNYFIHN